jgi:fatty-acyl-CoA synthase
MAFRGLPVEAEPGVGALTLPGMLAALVERHGDAPAIRFPATGATLTYRDLDREARAVAGAVLAAGIGKGGRVAVLLGNRPEWVAAAFGVTMAGGVFVPLNTWFEPPELDYVLRHSDASILITQPELAGHRYLDAIAQLHPSPLAGTAYPYLRRVVCIGGAGLPPWAEPFEEFVAASAPDEVVTAAAEQVEPLDDAVVIYTSGSTARPKGVLHRHRAAALQSWRFVRHLCIAPGEKVWSAQPLFWTAGFAMTMGGTLCGGGCLVLQERFEPGEALRILSAERCTMAHAWPHQLAELEAHPDWASTDLSSLRKVESFGVFGRHPTVGPLGDWSSRAAYGSTETFTIVSSDPADTPWKPEDPHNGHILPGNEVRIVDPASGQDESTGGSGEILVRGATLMRGYLKAPDDGLDEDGWFHTGDAGFVDGDGRLHWTGRTSDLIKTGGANVSPVEIEEALADHPGIKVARAVGVPDDLLGQIVVVCAVPVQGTVVDEAAVREYLRGKIASYKIPRRVLFVSDADLNLTGNAKVRVEALRQLAASRLS